MSILCFPLSWSLYDLLLYQDTLEKVNSCSHIPLNSLHLAGQIKLKGTFCAISNKLKQIKRNPYHLTLMTLEPHRGVIWHFSGGGRATLYLPLCKPPVYYKNTRVLIDCVSYLYMFEDTPVCSILSSGSECPRRPRRRRRPCQRSTEEAKKI